MWLHLQVGSLPLRPTAGGERRFPLPPERTDVCDVPNLVRAVEMPF